MAEALAWAAHGFDGADVRYGPVIRQYREYELSTAPGQHASFHTLEYSGNDRANCTIMCPSLMNSPQQWPLWIIAAMYASLLGFAVAVMRLTPLKSSRTVLLSMQVLLLVIRVCSYIFAIPWTETAARVVIVMVPIYLQFITFLLVAGYILHMFVTIYIRIERRWLWQRAVNWALAIMGLVILAMDVGLFVYCEHGNGCGDKRQGYDHNLALFSALTFGTITLLLGVSGVLARSVIRKCRNDREESKQKLRIIFRVLVMYTVVFAGRSIWAIAYASGVNKAQDYIAHLSRTNITGLYITSIVFYGVFEILPMAFLIASMFLICKLERDLRRPAPDESDVDSLDEQAYLIQDSGKNSAFSSQHVVDDHYSPDRQGYGTVS